MVSQKNKWKKRRGQGKRTGREGKETIMKEENNINKTPVRSQVERTVTHISCITGIENIWKQNDQVTFTEQKGKPLKCLLNNLK